MYFSFQQYLFGSLLSTFRLGIVLCFLLLAFSGENEHQSARNKIEVLCYVWMLREETFKKILFKVKIRKSKRKLLSGVVDNDFNIIVVIILYFFNLPCRFFTTMYLKSFLEKDNTLNQKGSPKACSFATLTFQV